MITKLFEMNFENLGKLLDSRIVKPPIFDIITKSKNLDYKHTFDAFIMLIP